MRKVITITVFLTKHFRGQSHAWELYESCVNRFGWKPFVQLSCARPNEDESCMRVECGPDLDGSFVQPQSARPNKDESFMRVEWPDLDMRFNSHARGQLRMKVVWELSGQIWMWVLFISLARGLTRWESMSANKSRSTTMWCSWICSLHNRRSSRPAANVPCPCRL